MYDLMQKPHSCDLFCHLCRLVLSHRPDVLRWRSGRGRLGEKHVNVKNEGMMQKTNHQVLLMNVIRANIQA